MLKSLWAGRWYWALGLLCFVLFLLVTVPVHFAWKQIKPVIGRLPVVIENPTGSLWQGEASFTTAQLGKADLSWQLSPLGLLVGQAGIQFDLEADSLSVEGQLLASGIYTGEVSNLELKETKAFLDSKILVPYLRPQRITLEGEFELSDLNLSIDVENRVFHELSGQLVFAGGEANVPGQRGQEQLTLPIMVAELGMQAERVQIPVSTIEGEPLGQIYLQPDGWGGVSVLKRSFDVVGQVWPDKQADADTVVFEVSQKVL